MKQNLIAQFIQLWNIGCVMWPGVVVEKNWALPVDQRQVQALQLWVHLISLLSILLSVMVSPAFRKL